MRTIKRLATLGVLLTMLNASGCAWHTLFTPPAKTQAAAPNGTAAPAPAKAPVRDPGAPGWQPPPPAPQAAPNAAGPVQQAQYQSGSNEHLADMTQRLANADEDRRILAVQLKQLQSQLRERDRALTQATVEIQEATSQTARTREELQRWRQEMESLRGKLRSVERDNQVTLESIIRTLEQFLDRDRDGRRTSETLLPSR